ncbi:MAG: alpha/beta hydrolase family protein [Alphaproteobacteria bacterium]|jgi:pimeloyl-ACP methyl ester carboxylesterase
MTTSARRTFVLVHGAWHGGWCWRDVGDALRAEGHRVFTPTLTGLGERTHLLSAETDLMQHVDDVVQVLEFEELDEVVLVGHSYAGPVITGVADRVAGRLSRLVYLDAAVYDDGEALVDVLPAQMTADRRAEVIDVDGVLCSPTPTAARFGVDDPGKAAWVERHLVPQPLACSTRKLELANPVANGLPADYIVCTVGLYAHFESSRQKARACGFSMHEIATGHDAMVTMPADLTAMLMDIAR